VVKWFWWLAVSAIPVALWLLQRSFMDAVGCPPAGDCYEPGTEILLEWDLLIGGTALLLWPVSIWHLGAGWVFQRVMKRELSSRGDR
jgi:hypothetical protein